MRRILRQREVIEDEWRELGAELPDGCAVIVPLAALRADPQRWQQWCGRLGVRLSPPERAEELVTLLPRLSLVAVEFASAGDGRGYSEARVLRERLDFRGELRATGAGVLIDQVYLLSRCGFDTLQLAPGEDLEAARQALQRYDVAYQPGGPASAPRRQRFFVPSG